MSRSRWALGMALAAALLPLSWGPPGLQAQEPTREIRNRASHTPPSHTPGRTVDARDGSPIVSAEAVDALVERVSRLEARRRWAMDRAGRMDRSREDELARSLDGTLDTARVGPFRMVGRIDDGFEDAARRLADEWVAFRAFNGLDEDFTFDAPVLLLADSWDDPLARYVQEPREHLVDPARWDRSWPGAPSAARTELAGLVMPALPDAVGGWIPAAALVRSSFARSAALELLVHPSPRTRDCMAGDDRVCLALLDIPTDAWVQVPNGGEAVAPDGPDAPTAMTGDDPSVAGEVDLYGRKPPTRQDLREERWAGELALLFPEEQLRKLGGREGRCGPEISLESCLADLAGGRFMADVRGWAASLRLSLVRVALESGGGEGLQRAVTLPADAPLVTVLETLAGLPLGDLLNRWRASLDGARPYREGRSTMPLAPLAWAAFFGVFALRSTRWRF